MPIVLLSVLVIFGKIAGIPADIEYTVLSAEASSNSEPLTPKETSGHLRMLTLLKAIADGTSKNNIYLGNSDVRFLRNRLSSLPVETSNRTRWTVNMQLGHALLRLGDEEEGIDCLKRALELTELMKSTVPAEIVNHTLFRLGVANMRRGETENCCLRNTVDSCILPIRGGGIHVHQQPSNRAISYFGRVLQNTPKYESLHLAARWLLNIAYMTIGSYPEQGTTEIPYSAESLRI